MFGKFFEFMEKFEISVLQSTKCTDQQLKTFL